MRLTWDIEANGRLEEVTQIHCIAAVDRDTKQEYFFGPDRIQDGLNLLSGAEELWGHYITGYDCPALLKVHGWKPSPTTKIRDTLVLARTAYPDRKADDARDPREAVQKLAGGHSLRDWGIRLDEHKLDYSGPWDAYSDEMGTYCQQDTRTNDKLADHLVSLGLVEEVLDLEHEFAQVCEDLHHWGFSLDLPEAQKLCERLETEVNQISQDFKRFVPDTFEEMKKNACWIVVWPDGSRSEFSTKGEADKQRKALGIKPKDCEIIPGPKRQRTIEFNVRSDQQVRDYLYQKYQWISPNLTDTGNKLLDEGGKYDELALKYGSVTEDMLRTLDFEEAKPLADSRLLLKRLSQLRDGGGSLLNSVREDGRIHHTMIHIGCVTFRCAHSKANLGQVPGVIKDKDKNILWGLEGRYGAEFRKLFYAREGYQLCGTDLSGIEARLLAHFLAPYDKGRYVSLVLDGDIHAANAEAILRIAGYPITRGDAKTPLYGWLYGSGHEKLGRVVVSTTAEAKKEFQEILKGLSGKNADHLRIASLARWGTEYPRDRDEKRFKGLYWTVKGCDNLQTATSLAYAAVGGRIDRSFQEGITGLGELLADVRKAASRGYLKPLDGRKVPVRHEHAALNSLLQSSAAVILRKWVVGTVKECKQLGLDAHIAAVVHDEIQAEVIPEHLEKYQSLCLGNIKKAGEYYRLAIRLDGDSRIGKTWLDTH